MNKLMYLWIIIVFTLVGILTFIGFKIKDTNTPYVQLEKELKKKAISLVGEKPYIIDNNNKITIQDFIDNNYKINNIIDSDVCEGYVIVEQKLTVFEYKPYIKCSKYQTRGYSS